MGGGKGKVRGGQNAPGVGRFRGGVGKSKDCKIEKRWKIRLKGTFWSGCIESTVGPRGHSRDRAKGGGNLCRKGGGGKQRDMQRKRLGEGKKQRVSVGLKRCYKRVRVNMQGNWKADYKKRHCPAGEGSQGLEKGKLKQRGKSGGKKRKGGGRWGEKVSRAN